MLRNGLLAMALLTSLVVGAPGSGAQAQNCRNEGTGLVPLTEMGEGRYAGLEGGLYPGASSTAPVEHLALGLDIAEGVQPLDGSGSPDPNGVIGVVSIGVSNTRDHFEAFIEEAAGESDLDPRLTLVNGAQGARDLNSWANASRSNPWRNLATILRQRGVVPAQVQVAWIMLPDRSQGTPELDGIPSEVERLTSVVQHLKTNFPNIRLAYLSSRIYGGYAPDGEPRAYQHGFTVKALIERQISGDPALDADPDGGAVVPWLAWGPYTWADGTTPRGDGLTWDCADFEADGIHPSPSGTQKVARLLLEHFRNHPTAASWFVQAPSEATTSTSATLAPTTTTAMTAPTSTTLSPAAPTESSVPASPPPAEEGIDVAWLLGGTALGVVLAVGAAWVLRERTPPP